MKRLLFAVVLSLILIPAVVAGQTPGPKLRGLAFGFHAIWIPSSYGEPNTEGPGPGLGVEVAFAPSRFLAIAGAYTNILTHNDYATGWQALEGALQPRYPVGGHLLIEGTAALGRTVKGFSDYTFAALGAGIGLFPGSRFAVNLRVDRVVPFDSSFEGYRRTWLGFVVYLGH
jgi:hypothetical protein